MKKSATIMAALVLAGTATAASAADWYTRPVEGRLCEMSRGYLMNNRSLGAMFFQYDASGYRIEMINTGWKDISGASTAKIWSGGMDKTPDFELTARAVQAELPTVVLTLSAKTYERFSRFSRFMINLPGTDVGFGLPLPTPADHAEFRDCIARLESGELKRKYDEAKAFDDALAEALSKPRQ